jgi:hypothetical protein
VDVYSGGDLRKMKTAQHLRQIGADQVAALVQLGSIPFRAIASKV